MNCKKCGNIINNDTKFCPVCGEKILEIENNYVINQQTIQENNNINNNKTNNKNKIIIIIAIIMGIIIVFFAGMFSGKKLKCENNNNCQEQNNVLSEDENDELEITDDKVEEYTFNLFEPSKIQKVSNNDTELTKKITINEIFFNQYNASGKYVRGYIYGKNNNSTPVEIKVILEYYDSEGYRIEKTSDYSIVFGESEFIIDLYINDDSLDYSSVKLFYEASKIKSYQTSINPNEIKVTNNLLNDGNINIIVENNSNEKIFIGEIACLYYKNKKLVFAQNTSITSVEATQKVNANCYDHILYLNDDYDNSKKIEYDDFKVVLYSAYNSNSTNY